MADNLSVEAHVQTGRQQSRCRTSHHGLCSNRMALITSDCGAMRSRAEHGPNHLGLSAPAARTRSSGGVS